MSDHPLQDAAARPSSAGLHVVGLAMLVGGLLAPLILAALGLAVPVPWSLVMFAGAVMLFVAARRRR